ncbi:MAG TPA: ATP-binding protein [Verrucomicrobiae bacterium]|nr:ATP-binding protein [Verrucomicrobiae bacterium]
MNPGVKLRLVLFIAAIALLVALIAWTAHTAWRRIGQLHEKVATVQWASFQIADYVQQKILSLNNSVLRFAAYRDPLDWSNFVTTSRELGQWLQGEQPLLSEKKEKTLLFRINIAYSNYVAAADAVNTRIFSTRQSITRLDELTDFELQSRRVLELSLELARAHQDSLASFQKQTSESLDWLRDLLFGALALLLAAGACLAFVVYRDLIAPLQVQLVESRQLAERQEKLASLGLLAAGVAHEIRNPLTAIKAWLYMHQKRLKTGTPEYADAHLINGEINRLERIVRDFLQFARPSDPQLTEVPADQPLREVQMLLAPELEKAGITLAVDGATTARVRMDPDQIKQVLINLVRNAAESIERNGRITLRARLDEKRLADKPTEVVILEVSDTGKGIPPEVEKRLFDPFFTTKDSGTGLGLPIAARIVEKHGGALQYQTQINRGTTFGIILPRVQGN